MLVTEKVTAKNWLISVWKLTVADETVEGVLL
jgi:hypothetical protein